MEELFKHSASTTSLTSLAGSLREGMNLVKIVMPMKQTSTSQIGDEEILLNIVKSICEKRQLEYEDYGLKLVSSKKDETLDLSLQFRQIYEDVPPAELQLVRVKRRSVLMPASSRDTSLRSISGDSNGAESDLSAAVSRKLSREADDAKANGVKDNKDDRRRAASVSVKKLSLRPTLSELGGVPQFMQSYKTMPYGMPGHLSNQSTASVSSLPELAMRYKSTTESSLEVLGSKSAELASETMIDVEKLNIDTGKSTQRLKEKKLRPRSISVTQNAKPSHDTLNQPGSPKESEEIFVRIIFPNSSHTTVKATTETAIEDILRGVCERKKYNYDAVSLQLPNGDPLEMDRQIGSFKLKEHVFHLKESGEKSYSSMIVTEGNRDVMTLTYFNGKLEVMAGTHEKLVERLTDEQETDKAFVDIMLMTYRSFMTGEEFLDMLTDRFNAEPPNDPTDEEIAYYAKWIIPVRTKVLRVLTQWVKQHYTDFSSQPSLRAQLQKFFSALNELNSVPLELQEIMAALQNAATEQDKLFDKSVGLSKSGARLSRSVESQLMTAKAANIAQQLCLFDHKLLSGVDGIEYLNQIWNKPNEQQFAKECPNLAALVNRFNQESNWVGTELLELSDLSQRVNGLKKLIEIAKECLDLNNFFSLFAILSGLNQPVVGRLKKTWAGLPSASKKLYEDLEKITDPSKNMARYRDALTRAQPPLLPFLPIIIKDLTFMNDGNPSLVNNLINFDKLRSMANQVQEMLAISAIRYTFNVDNNLQNYISSLRNMPQDKMLQLADTLEPREVN